MRLIILFACVLSAAFITSANAFETDIQNHFNPGTEITFLADVELKPNSGLTYFSHDGQPIEGTVQCFLTHSKSFQSRKIRASRKFKIKSMTRKKFKSWALKIWIDRTVAVLESGDNNLSIECAEPMIARGGVNSDYPRVIEANEFIDTLRDDIHFSTSLTIEI